MCYKMTDGTLKDVVMVARTRKVLHRKGLDAGSELAVSRGGYMA